MGGIMFTLLDAFARDMAEGRYTPGAERPAVAADVAPRPVVPWPVIATVCLQNQMTTIQARFLFGRLANGAEADRGRRWHAVAANSRKALCGAEPGGRRSVGWGPFYPEGAQGHAVTCPRCLRRLAALTAAKSK